MTAHEIIQQIEKLSPEEKLKVINYIDTIEADFIETDYSPEIMAELDQAQEEAKNGINISPKLNGEEAIDYLMKLKNS